MAADEGPRPWTAAELGDVQAVASGSVPFVAVGSTLYLIFGIPTQ